MRLAGEATGYGDGRQRSLALAGEDDVIPRGYRHGDDLRRVHWRSTARYGELMVRREEQPQRARCTVLLDTRRDRLPRARARTRPSSGRSRARRPRWCTCWSGASAVRLLTDTGTLGARPRAPTASPGDPGLRGRRRADDGHPRGRRPLRRRRAVARVRRAARRRREGCWSPSSAISTRSRRRGGGPDAAAQRRRPSPSCWTAARRGRRRRWTTTLRPRSGCGCCARRAGRRPATVPRRPLLRHWTTRRCATARGGPDSAARRARRRDASLRQEADERL